MNESVIEIMRASLLAFGTAGVLAAVVLRIAAYRHNRRTESSQDQPEGAHHREGEQ